MSESFALSVEETSSLSLCYYVSISEPFSRRTTGRCTHRDHDSLMAEQLKV